MRKHWHEAKTGNHQGLVIEEETGRNVAIAYDKADAPLIAAAPAMAEALRLALPFLRDHVVMTASGDDYSDRIAYDKCEESLRTAGIEP